MYFQRCYCHTCLWGRAVWRCLRGICFLGGPAGVMRSVGHVDRSLLLTSKHKTFVEHFYNVGPTSKTLGRRCTLVIQMFCVCWVTSRSVGFYWPPFFFLVYGGHHLSLLRQIVISWICTIIWELMLFHHVHVGMSYSLRVHHSVGNAGCPTG